jgi:phytoene dehydrogenase-like protein
VGIPAIPKQSKPDAIVIGSGPNGLAAAITIAHAGHSVVVYEAESTIGGGARSAQLTLPGFTHDVCSSVHPMAVASPFFQMHPLRDFGLEWIFPEAGLAHPFDDGTAIVLTPSLAQSCEQFESDARSVFKLLDPLVKSWAGLVGDALRPLSIPRHPWAMARFGLNAMVPAATLAARKFKTAEARAVFAGLAAHSLMPLTALGTSTIGLVIWTACHTTGWPFARGGSQAISAALAGYLKKLGGEIKTGARIDSLDDLPKTRAILCDLTPRQLARIAGNRLSSAQRQKIRQYRYGPGAFKIDWALDAPIPWNAKACMKAGTVHLGATLDEIVAAEAAAYTQSPSERPFVLITQPSLFDPTRAPAGKHIAWGYCHVPAGSNFDMLERIESQVERFAAGFKRHIIGRSVMPPAELEKHNANLIEGDILGGTMSLGRLLPKTRSAYKTSIDRVFLCSSSTPPGPGVHGLCGYFAAQLVNDTCF